MERLRSDAHHRNGAFLTLPPEEDGEFTHTPLESFIDYVFVRGEALLSESSADVLQLDETVARYEDAVSPGRHAVGRR